MPDDIGLSGVVCNAVDDLHQHWKTVNVDRQVVAGHDAKRISAGDWKLWVFYRQQNDRVKVNSPFGVLKAKRGPYMVINVAKAPPEDLVICKDHYHLSKKDHIDGAKTLEGAGEKALRMWKRLDAGEPNYVKIPSDIPGSPACMEYDNGAVLITYKKPIDFVHEVAHSKLKHRKPISRWGHKISPWEEREAMHNALYHLRDRLAEDDIELATGALASYETGRKPQRIRKAKARIRKMMDTKPNHIIKLDKKEWAIVKSA